jgi:hypothetical protein
MNNEKRIIESLKICTNDEIRDCDKCICNNFVFDKCQDVLMKRAIELIAEKNKEIKLLKITLEETSELAKELLYHIGG